jgi:hypothetical protein
MNIKRTLNLCRIRLIPRNREVPSSQSHAAIPINNASNNPIHLNLPSIDEHSLESLDCISKINLIQFL